MVMDTFHVSLYRRRPHRRPGMEIKAHSATQRNAATQQKKGSNCSWWPGWILPDRLLASWCMAEVDASKMITQIIAQQEVTSRAPRYLLMTQ